jgi:hypothetical protein
MGQGYLPVSYLAFTLVLPILWCGSVALAGGYEPRFIGAGSDEFRRVLNAAVGLAAGVAIASYAFKIDVARGYILIALPSVAVLDMAVRYRLRKRLYKQRSKGPACSGWWQSGMRPPSIWSPRFAGISTMACTW